MLDMLTRTLLILKLSTHSNEWGMWVNTMNTNLNELNKKVLLLPLIVASIFVLFLIPAVHAELKLDNIQFDPAIISSGDSVDIVVQFHDAGSSFTENRLGNPDYRYQVVLESDASLTDKYVLIEDSAGNDLQGIISRGDYFNKRFRVKVQDNAPAGNYEFKLTGQWYYKGQATNDMQYLRFSLPVKKQGVVLSVANVVSNPEKIRSGDKNILLTTTLVNTGEKLAKNVRIKLSYPDGISSAYTNNNDLNVGSIETMQQHPVQFYIDTDRFIKEGVYDIQYLLTYQDVDNNNYELHGSFQIVIKKKPNIVVVQSVGTGLAGKDMLLKVLVQNKGEETADAVDVRVLKQSSQPFDMDVRSDYLGQLKPGENGTAVFTLSVKDEAEIKDHKLTVVIRAKGDGAEGDDNVYTYTDAAVVSITGKRENNYPMYAGIFLVLVVITAIVVAITKSNASSKRK